MSRGALRIALIGVVLAAFALRLWRLDAQELRGDEAFGYFFSLDAPWTILDRTLDLGEPHPVVSYWLQHGWLRLAGESEFALRFQSVWWNTLAVALVAHLAYLLGMGPRAVGLAALMMALSPYILWHAQDARMYSMSLALTLAAMVAAVHWWARPTWTATGLYLAAAFLALHTHYYTGFVLAVTALGGLVWCYRGAGRPHALRWLAVQAGLALLYLPWLVVALPVVVGYGGNGDSPGLGDAVARTLAAMALGEVELPPLAAGWAALLAITAAAGFGALYRQGGRVRQTAWLLLVYALLPLLATWVGSRTRPIFDERYLVTVAPPVYLLAAACVEWPLRRPVFGGLVWTLPALVVVGMVAGVAVAVSQPAYSKDRGWRALAQRMGELSQGFAADEVRLVQNYPDPTLWYYYRGASPHLVLPPSAHDRERAAILVAEMADLGVERVIFVAQPSAEWDAQGLAWEVLTQRFSPVAEMPLAAWNVLVLDRPRPVQPLAVEYANGLRLVGAGIAPAAASGGGVMTVALQFEGHEAVLRGTEKLSVQVVDEGGNLVAQVDVPLATAIQTTGEPVRYGILMPDRLAGRTNTVSLVIYDPARQPETRLPTRDGREVVPLATLPVESAVQERIVEVSDAGAP